MFEHLDPHDPFDTPPDARDKVSTHLKRRLRRRRQRWALAGVVALVVAAAVGVPLGLGAAHQKHPTDLVTTDRGAAPPSTSQPAPPSTSAPATTTAPASPRGSFSGLSGVVLAPDGEAWAIGPINAAPLRFGVEHSTDGGRTWQRVVVPQLANVPTSADPWLRAAAGGRLWILSNLSPSILAMTEDGGAHWSSPASSPRTIVDLQAVGSSVWALTDPCPGGSPSCTKVLMTSSDGGHTWSTPAAQPVTGSGPISHEGPGGGGAVVRVGAEDGWVFTPEASTAPGTSGAQETGSGSHTWNYVVSRTTDGGRSWRSLGPISTAQRPPATSPVGFFPCGTAALTVPPTGQPWFLCTGDGAAGSMGRTLLTSNDGGLTWQLVHHGFEAGYPSTIVAFDDSNALLAGSRMAIERTTDKGETWTPVKLPGYQGDFADLGLACEQHDRTCLAFETRSEGGTAPNVWRSTDGGAAWSQPLALSATSATTVPPTTGPHVAATTPSSDREVLAPAKVGPVGDECRLPITREADGNVTPLLCGDGGVNALAWMVFSHGCPRGGACTWSQTMALGRQPSVAQLEIALCADYRTLFRTNPLTISAGRLAAAYYGWGSSLTMVASGFLAQRACPNGS
jgi:photosystem II stability/assembly factor-like uncharacterized protein